MPGAIPNSGFIRPVIARVFTISSGKAEPDGLSDHVPPHARGEAAGIAFGTLPPPWRFVFPLTDSRSQCWTNNGVGSKDGVAVDAESLAERQ